MKKILPFLFLFIFFGFWMTYLHIYQTHGFEGVIKTHFVPVHTQVNGHVQNIMKTPGEAIESGNPILEINRDIELANLQYIEALKKEAESELNQKKIEIDSATQKYIDAQATTDSPLKESSFQKLIQTQASYNSKEAHLKTVQEKLKLSELKVQKRIIRAPVKGVIYEIFPVKGAYVKADEVIGTLYDPQNLWVEIFIQKADMNKIAHRKKARIELVGMPGKLFEANVDSIISKNLEKSIQITVFPSEGFPLKVQPGTKVKVWF